MKKLLVSLFLLISLKSFSQKECEKRNFLIDYLQEKTKLDIKFVSYMTSEKDSILLTKIIYFDKIKKEEIVLKKEEINKLFPNVLEGYKPNL